MDLRAPYGNKDRAGRTLFVKVISQDLTVAFCLGKLLLQRYTATWTLLQHITPRHNPGKAAKQAADVQYVFPSWRYSRQIPIPHKTFCCCVQSHLPALHVGSLTNTRSIGMRATAWHVPQQCQLSLRNGWQGAPGPAVGKPVSRVEDRKPSKLLMWRPPQKEAAEGSTALLLARTAQHGPWQWKWSIRSINLAVARMRKPSVLRLPWKRTDAWAVSDRVPAPFPALRTGKFGTVAREDTRLAAGQGGTQRGSGGSSHTERTKGRWKKPLRRAGRARGPVTELLPQDTGSTGKWKPAANKWCSQLVAWHRIQEEGSLIFSSMLLRGLLGHLPQQKK